MASDRTKSNIGSASSEPASAHHERSMPRPMPGLAAPEVPAMELRRPQSKHIRPDGGSQRSPSPMLTRKRRICDVNTTEADSASTDMSAMRSKLQRLRLDEHNRDEDEHMSEGVADTCAKHGNGGQEDVVNDEDNKSETRENEVERDLWDRIARFEKQKTAEAELRRERRTAACSEPHDERDKDTWLLEELGLYMWE